jgi:hypothetical protein
VPLVVFAGVLLLAVALAILLLPLSLVMRFRTGTARRQARAWVATLNAAILALSIALLLLASAVTNIWVPQALTFGLIGVAVGCLLGLVGLTLSRWEATSQALHYTPNRWLVLAITLLVSGRLLYGVWRTWAAWQSGADRASWLVASGAAGSLAAGAVVLGYYFTYWIGIRRRVAVHQRSLVRPDRRRRT